jgi:hypothetical protein
LKYDDILLSEGTWSIDGNELELKDKDLGITFYMYYEDSLAKKKNFSKLLYERSVHKKLERIGYQINRINYVLTIHLGSWTSITDAIGNIEQELSYDAWGNLRNADTWSGSSTY